MILYLQFCRPSKHGHELGLVIDGDEFCVRLREGVGRLNLDTVFWRADVRNVFVVATSNPRDIL